MMAIESVTIFFMVLVLPLTFRIVEKNLEMFLFVIGLLTATFAGVLNRDLFLKSITEPITITIVLFVSGLLFKWFHQPLDKAVTTVCRKVPFRIFISFLVIILGLVSSMITAIIAALILVSIIPSLQLDRKSEIRLTVLACFSIGLGAALTPVGEPLSTITISKLGADFFYLMRLIGVHILIAIILLGLFAAIIIDKPTNTSLQKKRKFLSEGYEDILLRALKIYFFVLGLIFLGEGFEKTTELYLRGLDPMLLYWINMISAVLDNATLAASEISHGIEPISLRAILLGLLISGGMLIPGNIPNIIAAGKLNITSKEWTPFGVVVGVLFMLLYFLILFCFNPPIVKLS